jgi:hypothetical protein
MLLYLGNGQYEAMPVFLGQLSAQLSFNSCNLIENIANRRQERQNMICLELPERFPSSTTMQRKKQAKGMPANILSI